MRIEHFYLDAAYRRAGIGGTVLTRLWNSAPPGVGLFRVGALRGSEANRFYLRHGFVPVSESEWDISHERPRHPPAAG